LISCVLRMGFCFCFHGRWATSVENSSQSIKFAPPPDFKPSAGLERYWTQKFPHQKLNFPSPLVVLHHFLCGILHLKSLGFTIFSTSSSKKFLHLFFVWDFASPEGASQSSGLVVAL
jgi:hypothetical protein